MRLFDKCAQNRQGWIGATGVPPEMFTVLCVDTITEHAWQEQGNRKLQVTKDNYCRPPWDNTFVESNSPSVLEKPRLKQFAAAVVVADDAQVRSLHRSWHASSVRSGAAVFLLVNFAIHDGDAIGIVPSPTMFVALRPDGSFLHFSWAWRDSQSRDISSPDAMELFEFFGRIAFLAFTFANCNRVVLDDITEHVAPTAKICRRLKIPEVKRYTLNIMGNVVRPARVAGEAATGVMPFHLCRGHFATYTAERPMFGNPKLVGRFWHPPHMKGKKENGEVVKDYAIAGGGP